MYFPIVYIPRLKRRNISNGRRLSFLQNGAYFVIVPNKQKNKQERRSNKAKDLPPFKVNRPVAEYEPYVNDIPFIDWTEAPTQKYVDELLIAAEYGVGVETASAWANIPSGLLRNWLARGRKEELEPFDPSKIENEAIKEIQIKQHKQVTVPCYALWMKWRKARAKFIINGIKKIKSHAEFDWKSTAWLLERIDPGTFARTAQNLPIRRDTLPHEKEIETQVTNDKEGIGSDDNVVIIELPSNGRKLA